MGGVKEIKINSTLWATPARLVNLIDFKPEKVSIETKTNAINNTKVHNIKYENGVFYLTINKLRGYFNFNNNHSILTMLFDDINKLNKYYQVWKDIFGVINRGQGELKLHEKVVLHDGDFPRYTRYKKMISIKTKDPIFTYRAQLINILDFNPKKISIEKVCAINDELERICYVKYGEDPFYLVIDDLIR